MRLNGFHLAHSQALICKLLITNLTKLTFQDPTFHREFTNLDFTMKNSLSTGKSYRLSNLNL